MDDPGSDHLVGTQRDATVGTKQDPAEGRVLFDQECDLVSTLIESSHLQDGWGRSYRKRECGRRLTVTVTVQKKSTLAEQTETDLAGDAMTCEQFRKKTDQKTKHGDTAVEHFGSTHALRLDLRLGSFLIPGIAGLVGRAIHEKIAA